MNDNLVLSPDARKQLTKLMEGLPVTMGIGGHVIGNVSNVNESGYGEIIIDGKPQKTKLF